MYETESQENAEAAALDKRLKLDPSGALRDRLIDELHVAADEIEAVLGAAVASESSRVLRRLLDAVRLSESVVAETWNAFHGSEARSGADAGQSFGIGMRR